jgi:hypothetical protein
MASPFQFSVRQLLIAVAFVAVGIVALRNANSYWMSAIWGTVPLLLAVGILLVIFRRGGSQAFWIGFALFGGMYAAVVMLAYWPAGNSPRYDPLVYHQLWTTRLNDWAYVKMIPAPQRESHIANPAAQTAAGGSGFTGGMGPGGFPGGSGFAGFPGGFGNSFGGGNVPGVIANPDYVEAITFQQIGHALWLLILAALGGKLAQWIYGKGPGVRSQEPGRS